MVGRQAYQHPALLAAVDQTLFGSSTMAYSESEVLERFEDYVRAELSRGTPLKHMTRHILGLFQGQPGAKLFRRYLSENAHKPDAGIETLVEAHNFIRNRRPDPAPQNQIQEATC